MTNIGKISIIQVIMFYGTMVVSYGFNYSGTIEIVKNKQLDNSIVFSSIISSKLFLSLFSSFLGFLVIFFFNVSCKELILIYTSFLIYFIGQSLYPEWLFHGLQKIKYTLYVTIIWKFLYVVSILLAVNDQKDFLFIILFDSILCFFVSVGSFIFSKRKFNLTFEISKIEIIKEQLVNNWSLFSSIVLTTIYTKGNFLFLGLCASPIEVAIYSIIERYVFMINGLLSLLNRILFPYLTIFRAENISKYVKIVNWGIVCVICIGLLLCISNLFFAKEIVRHLNDKFQTELSDILSVLSFSFISSSFCTFATTVLISEKRDKQINRINMIGLIVGIVWVAPLTYFFGGTGLAFGFITNSYLLVFLNIFVLFKVKKLYIQP